MIPASFDYHRPSTIGDAVELLVRHGDEARVLAGGHSLIPMMKLRMATPSHLVDLQAIADLRGIREENGAIIVGAMTTQRELIESTLLAERCPIIGEAALQIADPQVRYCGTLGGNVANGDPGNDMPAIMQALDASYQVIGRGGGREVPAREFYEAPFFTALGDDEILVSVRIPAPAEGHGYAYEKQKRKVGDYATAAAAVVLTMSGGTCKSAVVTLTNVGGTPLVVEAAASALVGTAVDERAIDEAVTQAKAVADPASDGRGPADFRRHVAGVMTRRAIVRALERAR